MPAVRLCLTTVACFALALLTSCGGGGSNPASTSEAPGTPVLDLAVPVWFVVADAGGGNGGNDWLSTVDITLAPPANGQATVGTGTGTSTIEAAAFWPGTDTLYAFDPDRLGTIDLTTGVWTQVVNRDVWDDGNPANFQGLDAARNFETLAPNTFSDIDSMFFDPNTGIAYGVARIGGADALFIFSEVTGRIVRGAFNIGGTAYDYVRIPPVQAGNNDVDDIAIDPDDGQLYGVANGGGNNDRLIRIDKFTGVSSDVGALGATDMEGFSFYNDGSMWGVTGSASTVVSERNSVWSINTLTGVAFDQRPLTAGGSDFEAMAFLTGDLNQYCGRVWCDDNGNGTQDPGENGVANVTLVLWRDVANNDVLDADTDIALVTATTDALGDYCFAVASVGEYVITLRPETLPADFVLSGPNVLQVSAPNVGQIVTGLDFVKVGAVGTIGDTVYFDADGDGTQDTSEPGIRNVTVRLIDPGLDGLCGTADDVQLASTVTDGGGYYFFASNPDGSYCVDVDESTLPVGRTLTTANEPYLATIAGGSNDFDGDFGYQWPATLGDRVWIDTNGDGVQDPGEPGLGGVDVTLVTPGPDGFFGTADDVTIGTMTTAADGGYLFPGLVPGSYEVQVDDSDAPSGSTRTTPAPLHVLLRPGQAFRDADFGYVGNGSIGDLVWNDVDSDGTVNGGETGLGGIVVNLTEAGPDGTHGTADDVSFPAQTTAGDGSYLFSGLPPGTYRVDVDETTLPPGLRTLTTGNEPFDVNLGTGVNVLTADFGYKLDDASIGDRVWNDLNGDGVQDGGEAGYVGVTVNLTEAGPDGTLGTADDVSLPPQVTVANGAYDFTALPAGTYRVDVDETTLPAGVSLTTGNEPHDVVLAGSQDYDAADFGYWIVSSIGDRVWEDLDNDTAQDAGEPGLNGVTVNLTEAGPDGTLGTADDVAFPAQVTAGNGDYLFNNLPPGLYRVDVDDTSLPGGLVTTTGNDPLDINLPAGTARLDADFGYWDPASIGDRVWDDLNGNGTQDPGEPGLVGVTVNLTEAGPDGTFGTPDDVTFPPQVTAANGIYTFPDLQLGFYRADVDDATVPAGYGGTTVDPIDLNLATGENRTDIDFGFWLSASVGDRVWADLDADGNQDAGEPGLVGVTVNLTEAGPDGTLGTPDDVSFPPQVTVANGAYDFVGLAPGTYRVDVVDATLPAGMAATTTDPVDVILVPGSDIDTVDFGYRHTGSIGDRVWGDTNGDTVQDAGEPGLVGVTVSLTEAGPDGTLGTPDDVTFPPQVTVANGIYNFVNLPPGTYRVDVDNGTVPAGLVSSTSNDPTDVVLPAGGARTDVDFGYWQPASVGDRVWADLNANGAQDGGEPGLVGVTVNLTEAGPDATLGTADDVSFPPQVTIANGAYDFTNLAPGTYRVDVADATVPAGMALTTTDPIDVVLVPGSDIDTVDFGYRHTAVFGDLVWDDVNGNGTQEPGELGLPGVRIDYAGAGPDGICGNADDVPLGFVITAGDGTYSVPNLPADIYCVVVDGTTVPPGYVPTFGAGIQTVVLTPGQVDNTVDFGYQQVAAIGDRVWQDFDGDGNQDPGEPGIGGVTVNLVEAGPDGTLGTPDDVTFPPQVTAGDGSYMFNGLLPGSYRVTVVGATVPAGMVLTTANLPHDIVLAPGGGGYSLADFGYRFDGSIGDRVWRDTNEDGVQDAGEVGINGVTVSLVGDGADNTFGTADDVVLPSQVTAGDGNYDFANLAPDTYRVSVGPGVPAGMQITTGNEPLDVVLAPSQDFDGADFGYEFAGSIGDRVWQDLNRDANQDAGETGINGVTVNLVEAGVDGVLGTADDVVFPPQVTAGDGDYLFDNLAPGLYRVDVDDATVPVGMASTTANDPLDVALGPAQVFVAADFGYEFAGSIGDRVWHDTNENGVQDAGEPGLNGVTVNLVGDGADNTFGTADDVVVSAQVTAGNGDYDFAGLAPDTYRVSVGAGVPAGMLITTGNDPLDVVLAAGQDFDDADFGFHFAGSIGDRVWHDLDFNGVQDAGEPGLNGVTVNLVEAGVDGTLGTADDVTFPAQATAGNGDYLFDNLPPGLYRVSIGAGVPAGMGLTTANEPSDVALGPAQVFTTADFGYQTLSSIGDFVWQDRNEDTVQDAGEPGIDGVTLNLVEAGVDGVLGTADDVSFPAQVTTGGGAYSFTGLQPGLYRVSVAGGVPVGMQLTTGNEPLDVTLGAAQAFVDADFGYEYAGSVGDRVWHDLDFSGAQNGGEPGLNGVTVDLVEAGVDNTLGTADDVTFPSQVTAGDGNYLFDNLPPGLYSVSVGAGVPAGMGLTSANEPLAVNLGPAEVFVDGDFGYQTLSTIGDFVWRDLNGDGVQDAGEPGIGGITLNLIEAGVDGVLGTADDVTFLPQVTAADGSYRFPGLTAGSYRVSVVAGVPAGMNLTTANEPLDVTLGVAQDFTDADFGYRDSGSIGDFVWNDADSSGVFDAGDVPLGGITVNLVEAGVDGTLGTADDVPFPPQVTAADGSYDFQFLAPGQYRVSVDETTLPFPMTLTAGTNPTDVVLVSGQDFDDADFGYVGLPFTVGDVIWIDSDGDGVYEPGMGEVPVPGVLVNIYDTGGTLIGTDTTNAAGEYRFTVFGGTYMVEVDPSNFAPGGPLEGLTTTGAGVNTTAVVSSDRFDLDFGFVGGNAAGRQFCQWWTTNLAQWPLTTIMVANRPHSQQQAMGILEQGNLLEASYYSGRAGARASVNPDVSIQLAWAIIGAKLNVAAGNNYSAIAPTLQSADSWLASVGIGSNVRQGHPQHAAGKAYYETINAWNQGN